MKRITELMNKGYFVQDIEYINSISDEDFEKLISQLPKSSIPKILKKEEILQILKTGKDNFNIKISTPNIKSKISIFDVLNILRERYIFLSSIIKKKLHFFNLISINKISKRYKTFSIIGCVYKIYDNKITLDDFSSKIDIYVNNKDYLELIEEDCIIGAKCYWSNDTIICEEIVFPEFEKNVIEKLKKEIQKLKIEILFNNIKKTGNVTIKFDENNNILDSVVYLNKNIPVHQIFINDLFTIIINKDIVKFEFEKFMKLRLVESNIEKTLKFGTDLFLIKNLPNLIILVNSDTNFIEEKENVIIVNISKNFSHFLINLNENVVEIL